MPEQIFYNGTVLTMDPQRPVAEAVAVRGDRILAVGSAERILAMNGRDTERIDLDGCCLLPGFHDSHLHLMQHGLELERLALQDCATLEEAVARVRERAASLPAGTWLLGSGFSTARWNVATLTREPLDDAAPDHPVFLTSQDHHSAWVNGRALELASLHSGTPDPEAGRIERDERGEPSGLLLERAASLVSRVVPPPSTDDLRSALDAAGEHLSSLGITTVHHMDYEPTAYWREIARAASAERLAVRVWASLDQALAEHAAAIGLATGHGGAFFEIGGAKFFADGALGSLTAWMLEPYAGTTERGVSVHGPDVLAERLPIVIDAGLTPIVHAIGDAANRAVLDALEATLPQWSAAGLRPRIEHVQHLHPDDLPRFARLGVIASFQPIHMTFDAKRIRELLPDRLERVYSIRALVESGAHVVFGSDTPVASPDVITGLRAATDRMPVAGDALEPSQAVSIETALAAYTREAAFAIGREGRSGCLRPGFDADFVILSGDPRAGLAGLSVEGTMLAGHWMKSFF